MLERLYQKIFVAIVAEDDYHEVMVVSIKNKEILFKERKQFTGAEPSTTLFHYVKKIIEETPLYYIAILNSDKNQGAIEGCSLHDIIGETDMSGSKTICRNKKWMLYASHKGLETLARRYSPIGLDFIFSPFSIIEHFFGDKIGGPFALYALAQKDSLTVAFFENGKLEYGHHYLMHQKETMMISEDDDHDMDFSLDSEEEEGEQGIRLDEIETIEDLDLIEGLDDLSDIEDLDSIEDIAEFSEEEPRMDERRIAARSGLEDLRGGSGFNDDYSRFELIQKTLVRFYASEHCRNRFVETVFIADAYGSGSDLKRFLEEELFLNVLVRKTDLCEEMIALCRIEEEGL